VVSAVDEEANEVDGEVDEAFNGITDDLAGAVVVTVLVAVGIDEQVREGIKLKPQFTCPDKRRWSRVHSPIVSARRTSMSNLISCVSWVRRGVSVQHPAKYVLDDKELERVSTLARIELEDARVELERAHEAAKSMNRDDRDMEADDSNNDEDSWVELVFISH